MAAPKSAYGEYNVWIKGKKSDGSPIERESGVAKFFKTTASNRGYFVDSDIVGDDQSLAVAKVKALFKLDRLASIKADGITGFIGQIRCNSDGTPIGINAGYHKDYSATVGNRYSGVIDTVKDEVGGVKYYHYLNDGGLNRRGDLSINTLIDTAKPYTEGNGFKITATYNSSFYNYTEEHGILWRKQGEPTYIKAPTFGPIGAGKSSIKVDYIADVDPMDLDHIIIAGNYYEILAYIQNSEGTIVGDLNTVLANAILMQLNYAAVLTPQAILYATPVNVYRDRRHLAEGTYFYTKPNPVVGQINPDDLADTGYYIYDTQGSVRYYHHIIDGVYQGSGSYAVPSYQSYFGRGSTYEMALQDAINNNWTAGQTYGRMLFGYFDAVTQRDLWYYDENKQYIVGADALQYFILSDAADPETGIYENSKIVNGAYVGTYPEV